MLLPNLSVKPPLYLGVRMYMVHRLNNVLRVVLKLRMNICLMLCETYLLKTLSRNCLHRVGCAECEAIVLLVRWHSTLMFRLLAVC